MGASTPVSGTWWVELSYTCAPDLVDRAERNWETAEVITFCVCCYTRLLLSPRYMITWGIVVRVSTRVVALGSWRSSSLALSMSREEKKWMGLARTLRAPFEPYTLVAVD